VIRLCRLQRRRADRVAGDEEEQRRDDELGRPAVDQAALEDLEHHRTIDSQLIVPS
jgi:hypothetical protein